MTDLLHPDLCEVIRGRLVRLQGNAPSIETIDAEIQQKAEHYDDTHGFFPNLNQNGPERDEVDAMVMNTYGFDIDWNLK